MPEYGQTVTYVPRPKCYLCVPTVPIGTLTKPSTRHAKRTRVMAGVRREKMQRRKGKPANWLLGTWRSDKERTIEAWGKHPPASARFRRTFVPDLGKMTITYGTKLSRTRFHEFDETNPYRVVWQSSDTVFVVFGRTKSDQSGQLIYFKAPDVYWVHCGRFVEYFSKQKRRKPQKPNKRLQATRAKPRAPEVRR
jgi:hypothetical protein